VCVRFGFRVGVRVKIKPRVRVRIGVEFRVSLRVRGRVGLVLGASMLTVNISLAQNVDAEKYTAQTNVIRYAVLGFYVAPCCLRYQ